MSFNNNGGQGSQDPYAYIGTEHHVRALEHQRRRDSEAARRWGDQHANDITAWQNHCAQLEQALAEWQRSHARQAQQIQELEASWQRLRQNTDDAISEWKAHSNRLKAENAELRAHLDQALLELAGRSS